MIKYLVKGAVYDRFMTIHWIKEVVIGLQFQARMLAG